MKLNKEFELIDNKLDKLIKDAERRILLEYQVVLKELRKELASLYEKYSVDGKLYLTDMNKYKRIDALEKKIEENINALYVKNRSVIYNTLKDSYLQSATLTTGVISEATGKTLKAVERKLNVSKVINEEMAGLNWGKRIGKQRQDIIFAVEKSVRQGLKEGQTYRTMAEGIKKELGKDAPRTTTIARTESGRVISTGQKEALDESKRQGVKMLKTWNTVEDERVRAFSNGDSADHKKMNGVTITYEEDFELPTGSTGFGPRLTGNASDDINCRCFISIEIV